MQQLLSVPEDRVGRNPHGYRWDMVRSFTRAEGLDGIELVLGNGSGNVPIPGDLVKTVHLPIWPGWIRPWKEPQSIPAGGDPAMIAAHYGATGTRKDSWKNSAKTSGGQKGYRAAVCRCACQPPRTGGDRGRGLPVHVAGDPCCHQHRLPTRIALPLTTGGEPPVTLAFENLWSPGLTFLAPGDAEYFAGPPHVRQLDLCPGHRPPDDCTAVPTASTRGSATLSG